MRPIHDDEDWRPGPPVPRLQPDGASISAHGFQRWRERVSPGASEGEIETRVWGILEHGERSEVPPPWSKRSHSRGVIYVADPRDRNVVLVVDHCGVITVLTPETSSVALPDGSRPSADASGGRGAADARAAAVDNEAKGEVRSPGTAQAGGAFVGSSAPAGGGCVHARPTDLAARSSAPQGSHD